MSQNAKWDGDGNASGESTLDGVALGLVAGCV